MRPPSSAPVPVLTLEANAAEAIVRAAQDYGPISGLTHNFYRYPARFSPSLVRAAIDAFTKPGDLVLDPFVGGGTTLVEALASGRHCVGTDISSLAAFVTEVKTTIYSDGELQSLKRWANRVSKQIDWRAPAPTRESYEDAGYLRHLSGRRTWRLRKAIAQALTSAERLRGQRRERFARCAVLRTAQWALDGRRILPSVDEFRDQLFAFILEMIEGSAELARVTRVHPLASVQCLKRSTSGLENEPFFSEGRKPRLVVTSPPLLTGVQF